MAQAGVKKALWEQAVKGSLCKFKGGRVLLSQGRACRLPGLKLCHMTFSHGPPHFPTESLYSLVPSPCRVNAHRG